jgi:hypothetical protein
MHPPDKVDASWKEYNKWVPEAEGGVRSVAARTANVVAAIILDRYPSPFPCKDDNVGLPFVDGNPALHTERDGLGI